MNNTKLSFDEFVYTLRKALNISAITRAAALVESYPEYMDEAKYYF